MNRWLRNAVLCLGCLFGVSDTLTAQDTIHRAGLLGRLYVDAQYIYIHSPEELEPLDDSITGGRGSINAPIPWPDSDESVLHQDVFASWRHVAIDGSIPNLMSFSTELDSWSIGTTLFADATQDIRPFLQLGLRHDIADISLSMMGFGIHDMDRTDALLLNPGCEFDLTESLALRTTLECELEGSFDTSLYSVEAIQWFNQHLFFRAGVLGQLDGDYFGGMAGGGLAW